MGHSRDARCWSLSNIIVDDNIRLVNLTDIFDQLNFLIDVSQIISRIILLLFLLVHVVIITPSITASLDLDLVSCVQLVKLRLSGVLATQVEHVTCFNGLGLHQDLLCCLPLFAARLLQTVQMVVVVKAPKAVATHYHWACLFVDDVASSESGRVGWWLGGFIFVAIDGRRNGLVSVWEGCSEG